MMKKILGKPAQLEVEPNVDTLPDKEVDLSPESPSAPTVVLTEVLLPGRRVTGEIRHAGVTRRLVDLLNAVDSYVTLHAGVIADSSGDERKFERIEIVRDTILLAFPRLGSPSRTDPGELIEKGRRLVTVALPGCEVSGYYHAAQGVQPSAAAMGAGARFVPLTNATLTVEAGNSLQTQFEPVILFNARHAHAYVWSDQTDDHPVAG